MKISQDMRTHLESVQKHAGNQAKGSANFDAIVQSQSRQLQEAQLNELLKTITSQGERVARFRSFKDLAKYKRLIKDFVKESVQYGMNLKHSHSWNQHGQTRKLTIVESVDEKLAELTDAVLDQEQRSIDLLGIIGEIKGLLINLYT
ncbi:YaaR family protein [Halobacillus yeomjeoni]|uniref:YaaR family protein n=1 Tax=Halobacillus yeomjeoni TaxID=311194 RepID=A0A931HY64_9BACI|nr:YaaR family protein [Halobacillus yeomjeoni]MBH0231860.1 YaaR family protein [Halobacillus yeomjeoni]MCA0985655.1 YaaR family protein [Halobacillus yeomjeoni]